MPNKSVDISKTKLDELPSGPSSNERESAPRGLSDEPQGDFAKDEFSSDFAREHLHDGLKDNSSHATHGLNRQSGINAQAPAHPPKGGKREHIKALRPASKPVE